MKKCFNRYRTFGMSGAIVQGRKPPWNSNGLGWSLREKRMKNRVNDRLLFTGFMSFESSYGYMLC